MTTRSDAGRSDAGRSDAGRSEAGKLEAGGSEAEAGRFEAGTFRPAPGRGSVVRMLLVQARTEVLLTLRNGEQLLLMLFIPLVLLIGLTLLPVLPIEEPRVDHITPRILALAVMSTAFTGQAIALGFDRRYGVLKRLAATALPRWSLVGARLLAVLFVVVLQLIVLGAVAAALGWQPVAAGTPAAVALILAGTAAFGALGILLGGTLRAEVVLAVANAIWLLLLVAGGIVLAVDQLPGPMGTMAAILPSGALAEGLQAALTTGSTPWTAPVALLCWAVGAGVLAARSLRLT